MNYNKQFNPYGTAFSILFEHEWFELAFDPHYCKIRGDLNFNFDYYEISRNNREGMYKNNFITPPLIAVEENELPHGKIIFDLFFSVILIVLLSPLFLGIMILLFFFNWNLYTV